MQEENKREIRSFVLRAGRMSSKAKERLDRLSDIYCVDAGGIEELSSEALFGNSNELIVEIGFGMADATYQIALENKDKNYLCFEVHTPGVARLLEYIENYSIENVKIVCYNVSELLIRLDSCNSVDGYHIFFPDPWPKKKHHKRRLIKSDFLEVLVKSLKIGGYIYFVSDWEDYALEVINLLSSCKDMEDCSLVDYSRFNWRPFTKFERKGLDKGHRIYDILFRKGE